VPEKTEDSQFNVLNYTSKQEHQLRERLLELFLETPIPKEQILSNIGLFLNSKTLSRLLFFDFLYRQILDVMGVICEFGTRWGPNLGELISLRGIYEPYNRHRKIIGFDTFSGFPAISKEDGSADMMEVGHLRTPDEYFKYLTEVLDLLEKENPLAHIKKHEIIKGDVSVTLPQYLEKNPETIISFAYFDLDLYQPTKFTLHLIKDRLVKGSVLGFDELNDPDSPGETLALMETFGLNNVKLKRFPFASRNSYFVVE
jgi:hypothetical protein